LDLTKFVERTAEQELHGFIELDGATENDTALLGNPRPDEATALQVVRNWTAVVKFAVTGLSNFLLGILDQESVKMNRELNPDDRAIGACKQMFQEELGKYNTFGFSQEIIDQHATRLTVALLEKSRAYYRRGQRVIVIAA
jgi:hypothetical protein